MPIRRGREHTVHIYSDGTPQSTRIVSEEGHPIANVRRIEVEMDAAEGIQITLYMAPGKIDIDGALTRIVVECPSCGTTLDSHCCGPAFPSQRD